MDSNLASQASLPQPEMAHASQLDSVNRFNPRFMFQQNEDFVNPRPFASQSSRKSAEDQEYEIRKLASEFENCSLDSIAEKIRMDPYGGSAEKLRQIFGVCWLKQSCEDQEDAAVQRNQIYAQYVDACNIYHVKTLSSASFGKLVRMLFPTIKTRRLGTRGHSKYHYCGLKLRGHEPFRKHRRISDSSVSPDSSLSFTKSLSSNFDTDAGQMPPAYPPSVDPTTTPVTAKASATSLSDPYTSSSPPISLLTSSVNMQPHSSSSPRLFSSQPSTIPTQLPPQPLPSNSAFSSSVHHFTSPFTSSNSNLGPSMRSDTNANFWYAQNSVYKLKLKFLPPHKLPWIPSLDISSFSLPPIDYYLSTAFDNHEAKVALMTVYSSHCITLIESIRYMHLKQFLSEISSFPESLSPSLLALLASPFFSKWIEQSDTIMYREILKLLFPMTLQVVPTPVLVLLRHLTENLLSHISSIYSSHSPCLAQVKIETAAAFSNLLSRLLRVNDTAHAAARFLANPADRQLICCDWERFVNTKVIVCREVMYNNKEAVNALDEWFSLLSTCSSPSELLDPLKEKSNVNDMAMHRIELRQIDGILDRMADFFLELPSRFPSCSPRMFLLYLSALQTSVLREITVGGGKAFGALWVIRCWVDEYMTWVAEIGGFLDDGNDEVSHAHFHSNDALSSEQLAQSLHSRQHIPQQFPSKFQNEVSPLHPQQEQPTKPAVWDAYDTIQKQREEDYMSIVFDTNGACS
ncbi:transcriptional repressor Sak1 [Schizosaccharomyces cryophilus OY26]|uniref:Transcriptional repressor Sak1 n=1 Tax=Schizosaccharomyces cryophilus (strain OY26 / ATCC MYA-4695 / CBS 11777 / NBRC 106824 / NRRL Y48691) TaxID=653667 RepID=S9W0M0_SCHCR|nr:transcriptional repressor Sak1 [Schizosaccharomyces cryophilus OY26]EPY53383.1 transcriptional repressor Sak1 [Schizosaccharomyces cryophilus OY26]